ncbi:hypothetical protein HYR54_15825 [Candidatus Acetothermia bacterium]|nr:hypothetical protein [Candidatus Acetothermia bacterium]
MTAEFMVDGQTYQLQIQEEQDLSKLFQETVAEIVKMAEGKLEGTYLASAIVEKLVDGIVMGVKPIQLGELGNIE